jgi:hypothetical protein
MLGMQPLPPRPLGQSAEIRPRKRPDIDLARLRLTSSVIRIIATGTAKRPL